MAKFNVGDRVTANYGSYPETGTVTKVVEGPNFIDYYVQFGGNLSNRTDFDIFSEDELEANNNG